MPDVVMSSCERNAEYIGGEYSITNNMWNVADAGNDPHTQCIQVYVSAPTEMIAGWNWDWLIGGESVKSFPCIRYGRAPWMDVSTTPHLPAKLSRLDKFIVSLDTTITITREGLYNTAFDLWITSDNPPTQPNITTEIMIWLNSPNWELDQPDGNVTINGQDYLYRIKELSDGYRYIAFQKVVPILGGTIEIEPFIKYLLNRNLISGDDYLADIEFGTEIVSGQGEIAINRYAIEYKAKDMDILLELQTLLAEIETVLNNLHSQSDAEAAKILTAQEVKAQADASIVTYDQVKIKCQEIIALLTP